MSGKPWTPVDAAAATSPAAPTLVDLMRETVETPDTVVDISALPLREITATKGGGIGIGALAAMAVVTADAKLNSLYPVAAQALRGASAQLRNMATIGDNIMQRTRCTYFRDVTADCNKREPGSRCAALQGYNRGHAILGGSGHCVAVHASDFAVALTALEATVHLRAPDGKERSLPFADSLLRPGSPAPCLVSGRPRWLNSPPNSTGPRPRRRR